MLLSSTGILFQTAKLAPRVFIDIATKLPNLKSMKGQLADFEARYPALRRTNRSELVHAIESSLIHTSVNHLNLLFEMRTHMNQAWQPANLLPPSADHDLLSSAVWKATCHLPSLTSLSIGGVVDASLFWPAHATAGLIATPSHVLIEPFWQNLTSLSIDFDMTSPSGEWYFRALDSRRETTLDPSVPSKAKSETAMPPGYDSGEQEDLNAYSLRYSQFDEILHAGQCPIIIFRLTPNEPVLVPLIQSFARACAQIPNLKRATLAAVVWELIDVDGKLRHTCSRWGIYFAAIATWSEWRAGPDEHDYYSYPEEDLTVPRLTLNTRNWRPDEDVCKLLREIGGSGKGLEEKYLDLWEMEKPEQAESIRLEMRLTNTET